MKVKGLYLIYIIFGILPFSANAVVTDPTAQSIPYNQDFSALFSTSTTYPAGWQGWKIGGADGATFKTVAPILDVVLTASGLANANAGKVYNYNGKIGFLQTGSLDPSLCFAVITTGKTGITVAYDVMTIRNPYDGTSNTCINEVTLQYRVGTSGAFTNLTGIEYQNNTTTQTGAVSTPQNVVTKSIMLPSSCDNQAVVELRWAARDVSGSGGKPSFAFDNITVNECGTNTSTYYYRSFTTGNWNYASSWEASPSGLAGTWIPACTPPTSSAVSVTILSGHTITMDANATAPDIIVNNGGVLIANNTAFTSLTISGNLQNDGTLQMVNGAFGTDVIFNKNGNQTITGTGATTNFYSLGVNMGASISNTLDISPTAFTSASRLFLNSSGSNTLVNGTIKFSGSYLYANQLYTSGPTIPATVGIWLNNANVTINAANFSYVLYGSIKVTSGTFNIGSAVNNSLRYRTGSSITIDGGFMNISGRLSGDLTTSSTTYNQSGGILTVMTIGSTSTTFGSFDLRSATSSFTMSGGTIVFNNGVQFYGIYDYYNLSGTNSVTGGTVQFCDNSVVATIKDFYVNTNNPIYNMTLTSVNASRVWLYHDLAVVNTLTLGANDTLDVKTDTASMTNPSYPNPQVDYNLTVGGDFTNSGKFYPRSKTVTFNGSIAQTINGASNTTFNNLTINNTSVTGVTLAKPTTVNSALTLTDGIIYSDATNLLILIDNATSTSGSAASFVDGPMKKIGDDAFVFPTGDNAIWARIEMSAPSIVTDEFTAQYFDAPYATLTPVNSPLAYVSNVEYWVMDRTVGTSTIFLTLYWEDGNRSGINTFSNDLHVGHYTAANVWDDEGSGTMTGSAAAGSIQTSAAVTTFSPFTFASNTPSIVTNPLPIELISFTANYSSNKQVDLKWVTASETNNNYFTIERSADAIHFSPVANIAGAGNSTMILNYFTEDDSPLSGVSYYRLKQTDFNGDYTYSQVIEVKQENSSFEILSTNMNDFQDELTVYFNCNSNCEVTIELYDLSGKKVYISKETITASSEIHFSTKKFSKGIYLLKAYTGEKTISQKIKL